eukprot:PhF_6_TR44464/c0_g1_i2/m.68446/K06047/TTL; tubulin---tyrosine ligase
MFSSVLPKDVSALQHLENYISRHRQKHNLEKGKQASEKLMSMTALPPIPFPRTMPESTLNKMLPPTDPLYTVAIEKGCGMTFEFLFKELLSRGYWSRCTVNTQKRKIVCCNRVKGVNVYLGSKTSVDIVANELKILQLRDRRMSSCTGVADPNQCKHTQFPLPPMSTNPRVTMLNYLENSKCITLKASMLKTLKDTPDTHAKVYIPDTFVLMPGANFQDDRDKLRKMIQMEPTQTVWIAKSSHGCGGSGHKIAQGVHIEQVIEYVDSNTSPHPWVVQRYIDRPFLIHGRKFDIRSWVLVTASRDPVIYLYQHGVLRTSSSQYDPSNLQDVFSHITNHCVQQRAPMYSSFEPGNEMWYEEFERYLATAAPDRSLEKNVLRPMRKIIIDTMKPILRTVNLNGNNGCLCPAFQLFGFDFMIDQDWKLWLLEINGSPAIAQLLVEQMIKDLVSIAIDPLFPPPTAWQESIQNNTCMRGNGFQQIYPSRLNENIQLRRATM